MTRSDPSAARPAHRVVRWGIPAVLAVAAWLAYANSFSVPLLLDDYAAIANNMSIRELRDFGAVLNPPADLPTAGRPILNLSFALNHAISGTDVWAYHATNLALHVFAGLTLFGLVRRTGRVGGNHADPSRAEVVAAFAAAWWLVHPVHTASVTYLSQRAEVMMGLFYLLALYSWIRDAAASRTTAWRWLAVAACAAGMLTKETMVTAPVMILLFDRAFLRGSFRAAIMSRPGPYLALAGTWLILAALMVQTRVAERGVGFGGDAPFWNYALTQCRVVLEYARLTVWPAPLVFDHGVEQIARSIGEVGGYVILLLGLVGVIAAGLAANRRWAFLGAAFLLVLAPTSSVVPVIHQPMAENRVYLSVAAVTIGMAALLNRVAHARVLIGAGVAVGLACVALTVRRNADFREATSLWADTVRKRPDNVRAHSHYGEALRAAGDLPAARREFETAVRLDPNYAVAHNNLAIVAGAEGRRVEAIRHAERAVELMPKSAALRTNLGNSIAAVAGRREEALRHYAEALALDPSYAEAHRNRAAILLQLGRTAEAVDAYAELVRQRPRDPEAVTALGAALALAGRPREALSHCETALRLDDENAQVRANLANVLVQLRIRIPEAVAHYEKAVALKPDFAAAWCNLGLLQVQMPGKTAEGVASLEKALQLQPDLRLAREALERVRGRGVD